MGFLSREDMPEYSPRAFLRGKRVLIFGASSDVAREFARIAAEGGASVISASRSAKMSEDLRARGFDGCLFKDLAWDAKKEGDTSRVWKEASSAFGAPPEVVLFAAGVMPNPTAWSSKPEILSEMTSVNLGSFLEALYLAEATMGRGSRFVAITSVSGDRARASNWAYGATKRAMSFAMDGLSMRAREDGPSFVDVRMGFCRTKMTEGMTRTGALWTDARRMGEIIARATEKGKRVVYAPGFWRGIMSIFKWMPRSILKKINI